MRPDPSWPRRRRLGPGEVRWLDAQRHMGENVGETPTHVVFIELKESRRDAGGPAPGPT